MDKEQSKKVADDIIGFMKEEARLSYLEGGLNAADAIVNDITRCMKEAKPEELRDDLASMLDNIKHLNTQARMILTIQEAQFVKEANGVLGSHEAMLRNDTPSYKGKVQ